MMKNIFTCSAFVLGVVCSAHIASAMNVLPALDAMGTCEGVNLANSYPGDKNEKGAYTYSPDAQRDLTTTEKQGWMTKRRVEMQKYHSKDGLEDVFKNTFADDFAVFFAKHTSRKNISDEARNLLLQHGAGNRVNVFGVMCALLAPDSCGLFCKDKNVLQRIQALEASQKIIRERYADSNLGGLLKYEDLSGEALLEEIKRAINDRNTFIQQFYNYFLLSTPRVSELEEEFNDDNFRHLSKDSEWLYTVNGNLPALVKFLGNSHLFNVNYNECSCTLNGDLAGLENHVKFDIETGRIYVNTSTLKKQFSLDIKTKAAKGMPIANPSAAAEFILCYNQYLYEEFILTEKLRLAFRNKKCASKGLVLYERSDLNANFSAEDDLPSLVINNEKMRQTSKIYGILSAEFMEMFDPNFNNYAASVFLAVVSKALGMSPTASTEEIIARGEALHARFTHNPHCDLPENFAEFRIAISDWERGHSFSGMFREAYDNILRLSSLKLGNENLIRYMFGALDRESENPEGSQFLIAGGAGYLIQGFHHCSAGQTDAFRNICAGLLTKDPNIKQTQDRLDAALNNQVNNIFNDIFSFREYDGKTYHEEVMARCYVLNILNGKYGLINNRGITSSAPNHLWCYYQSIAGTNCFAKQVFDKLFVYLDELIAEGKLPNVTSKAQLFGYGDVYRNTIIPQLAKIAFSPENLVQKLLENDKEGFEHAALLFVRNMQKNDEATIDWGRLAGVNQRKQLALDMLTHYGYFK